MNQQQVWDKIAKNWQKYRKKQYPDYLKFIKNKKGKLLDLGCGSGRNFIKNKNLKFYGVDFSSSMLRLAEERAKKLGMKAVLKKSPAHKLPFKDNFFDSAIFIAVLQCVEGEKKRKKSLQEMFRVLKPEGEAFITVWSRQHEKVKNKPKKSKIPWTVNGKKYYRYYYLYDKEELEKLIKEIGFKILRNWEDKDIIVIVKKPKGL